MNERAVRFGEAKGLVGILTEADPDRGEEERPTVILLNSGILHRVGASRLYVKLARELAGDGITAFRFDFSGVGDSDVRRDRTGFRIRSVAETQDAMDFVARIRGARSFVLGGLCSGADAAYWTAREDERVVGLIQMDAFAYPTARFHLYRVLNRLAWPSTWPSWIEARARDLLDRVRPSSARDRTPALSGYRRTFPPRAETAEGLRELVARQVAFYHFFSGSHRPYLNYRNQYAEAFPDVSFGDRLHVDYVPEADHTVTNLEHQRFLIDRVLEWTRMHWPRKASPAIGPRAVAAPKHDPLPTGAGR